VPKERHKVCGPLLKNVRKNLPSIFEAVVIIVLVKNLQEKNNDKRTSFRNDLGNCKYAKS
jgi:hypothetical protein